MFNRLVSTENMSHDEWLSWRRNGLGGSDTSIVCGINKYKSPVQLWMEKTGKIQSEEAGECAYWGTILEPIIRDEFIKRSNLEVIREPHILQHSKYNFMLANLDGVVVNPITGRCIFEAKTASQYKESQWHDDNIPEEYMLQLQHYFAVTGYKVAYIAVLIGGNQFKYTVVKRDEELIEMLIKIESDFWQHVVNDVPPSIDGSEASTELLNRLYSSAVNDNIILPLEAEELINQYEEASLKEKEIKLIKDEASNILKDMLKEHEIGNINDRIISWKAITSEKFDTKRFQAEHPKLYSRYTFQSNYRRFSIK